MEASCYHEPWLTFSNRITSRKCSKKKKIAPQSVADDLPCTEILYRGEVDLAFIGLEFRNVGSPHPVRFLYIEIPGKNILCHFSHVTFVRGVLLLRLDHSGYQFQFLHDPAYLLMVDCQPFIPEGEADPSESINTSGISKYFLYSFP